MNKLYKNEIKIIVKDLKLIGVRRPERKLKKFAKLILKIEDYGGLFINRYSIYKALFSPIKNLETLKRDLNL